MNDQEIKNSLPAPSNVPYLIAIVIMVLVAILAIVAVTIIRPTQDNSSLYVLILGSIGPTTLALLAFMKSQETHLSVNSRLEQFIKNADRSARAEGELAGRAAGRESADSRTDTLKEQAKPALSETKIVPVFAPVAGAADLKKKEEH